MMERIRIVSGKRHETLTDCGFQSVSNPSYPFSTHLPSETRRHSAANRGLIVVHDESGHCVWSNSNDLRHRRGDRGCRMTLVHCRVHQRELIADLHLTSRFRCQHDVALHRRQHRVFVDPQHVCSSSIGHRRWTHRRGQHDTFQRHERLIEPDLRELPDDADQGELPSLDTLHAHDSGGNHELRFVGEERAVNIRHIAIADTSSPAIRQLGENRILELEALVARLCRDSGTIVSRREAPRPNWPAFPVGEWSCLNLAYAHRPGTLAAKHLTARRQTVADQWRQRTENRPLELSCGWRRLGGHPRQYFRPDLAARNADYLSGIDPMRVLDDVGVPLEDFGPTERIL